MKGERGKAREVEGRGREEVSSPIQPTHNIVTPRNKKERPAPPEPSPYSQPAAPIARVLNVDTDMPIDPNEPTYCVCNRVSFGEMVGCDNPDVCSF